MTSVLSFVTPLPQARQICEDTTRSTIILPLPGWGREREVISFTPPRQNPHASVQTGQCARVSGASLHDGH